MPAVAQIDGAVVRMPKGLAAALLPLALSQYRQGYEPTQITGFLSPEHERFCVETFRSVLGVEPSRWYWHVTKGTPADPLEPNGEWRRGFPHNHIWPESATLIQYLQAPERGGNLAVKINGGWVEFTPEPGLCVFCSGVTDHGVRPILAGTRVASVATAWWDGKPWP